MGQRKQRGTQAPAPRQGMELHSLRGARDPAAGFGSQYRSPPLPSPEAGDEEAGSALKKTV